MINRSYYYNLFFKLGADRLVRLFHTAPSVLFYHGVAESPDSLFETESISVKDFCKQLEYLKKHYRVISIQEFEQRYKENRWEGNEILMTFDDGYKNMLTTGLPILESYGFPFVLFLTTNNISKGELFATTVNRLVVLASSLKHLTLPSCDIDTDLFADNRTVIANNISLKLKTSPLIVVRTIVEELLALVSEDELNDLRTRYASINPMCWEEAKQISESPYCTIGSHGIDHICCHELQIESEVEWQISESKKIIEQNLGIECNYFSYPNGSFTKQSNIFVKNAGYRLGFSTKRLPVDSLTECNIPRLYVPYDFPRFVFSLVTYPY